MFVYTIQPLVKPVWQQVVSCKRGFRKKASLVNFYSNQDPFYCIVQSPLNHSYWKRTKLLPPPRRICNCRCLSVCWQLCAETSKRICRKFSGKVGNGPMNKWLNFAGIRIRIQIATLVRRALAEVCTVAVLLVYTCIQWAQVIAVKYWHAQYFVKFRRDYLQATANKTCAIQT